MSNRRNKYIDPDLYDDDLSQVILENMRRDSGEGCSTDHHGNISRREYRPQSFQSCFAKNTKKSVKKVCEMHRASARLSLCKKIEKRKKSIPDLNYNFSIEHIRKIVQEYEDAIASVHKDSRKYNQHIASFTFNLLDRKNTDFLAKILNRKIKPTDLAKMKSSDIASDVQVDEKKREIANNTRKMVNEAMEDIRLRPNEIYKKTHKGIFLVDVNENFLLFPEEKEKIDYIVLD
jgi:hypothetical protein